MGLLFGGSNQIEFRSIPPAGRLCALRLVVDNSTKRIVVATGPINSE
jgi:hypothetical protein